MVEQLRRNTWNWLPAFLEIAECGSVVAASRRLGLTQAAVSRTLRLLEAELGQPLFNRVGRSLSLNQRGAVLRDAIRQAHAAVDAGLRENQGDPFVGSLAVSSIGVLTEHLVVPALLELKRRHPALQPIHQNLTTVDANALLARGQLDLALYYEQVTAPDLVIERLGSLGSAVYCGRDHPLFGVRRVTRRALLEHEFSIPTVGDTGRVRDGWPPDLPRRIGMQITMLRSNLQVALSGLLLTVLPDVSAAPHLARGELRRFAAPRLPPIEVYAARHASRPHRGGAEALIEAIRARLRRPR